MFFLKRLSNALSSSHVVLVTILFIAIIVSRSWLLHSPSLPRFLSVTSAALRHMVFFGLSLRLIIRQFPRRSECTRQYILARAAGEYGVSILPSLQESAGKSRAPPPETPLLLSVKHQISVPSLARPAKQISCLLQRKAAIPALESLHPLQAQCTTAKACLRSFR